MFSTQKTFKFSVDKQQYRCYSTIIAKNVNSKGGVHMRTNLFKKVLATVLATAVMWTSVAPSTVEAAKKDTKKPKVQVMVLERTKKYDNLGAHISYCPKTTKTAKTTYMKGYHKLKNNSWYSCRDLKIKVSDASGIKSIKLQGTVRDSYDMGYSNIGYTARKVTKKINVKSAKSYTFKLSENLNRKSDEYYSRVKTDKTYQYNNSTYISDGSYTLTVTDIHGNKTVTKFNIDSQEPSVTTYVPEEYLKNIKKIIIGRNTDPSFWVTNKIFDCGSGLDWIKINGKKVSCKDISKLHYTCTPNKNTTIEVCDKAGNINKDVMVDYIVTYSK